MSSGGSKHAQAEAFRKQMANRTKAASADFSKHVQPALEKVEFVANKIPALKQLEEATGVKKEYLLIILVVTVRLALSVAQTTRLPTPNVCTMFISLAKFFILSCVHA